MVTHTNIKSQTKNFPPLTIEASFRQEYFSSTIVKKGNKTVQNIKI
jgi:hypothetical protein